MLLYEICNETDRQALQEIGHTVVSIMDERGQLVVLQRCDGLIYRKSLITPSNQRILSKAMQLQMPIVDLDVSPLPTLAKTEMRYPQQCDGFLDIVMRMYRTHLQKNADYGAAAILGTGEVGLATRLWDKISRLLSLAGFELTVVTSKFQEPSKPNCEAIEDTLLDTAVYAVIGLLLRSGRWGR